MGRYQFTHHYICRFKWIQFSQFVHNTRQWPKCRNLSILNAIHHCQNHLQLRSLLHFKCLNSLPFSESLNRTKSLLEVAIVKWTEYEDHYQEASDWLTQTEQVVQTFNKLQDSLEEKKNVLEQFQVIAILTVSYSFCCSNL